MNIYKIIKQLEETSSTNEKLRILKENKNNSILQKCFTLAYDKVKYSYGIRKIPESTSSGTMSILDAFNFLEQTLATREVTGNYAISRLQTLLNNLHPDAQEVTKRILGRDLKCGVGRTQANKVWSGCITKPPYMRCSSYSEKLVGRLGDEFIVQLKADGRFTNIIVDSDSVTFQSRAGEEQEFHLLLEEFQKLPNGVYMGELLIRGETDRAVSNGLINSDNPPHEKIYVQLWDYISLEGFANGLYEIPYGARLSQLMNIIDEDYNFMEVIPYDIVYSLKEALEYTSSLMTKGYEGSILKNPQGIWKNGTSKDQIKLKVIADCTVLCVGFTEGTGRRAGTFGAIVFITDDGRIQGQTSGFTDSMLMEIHNNREKYIGKCFDVTFNDLTISEGSSTYALSHPRFNGWRYDRTDTDTLENVKRILQMAKELGC